MALATINQAIIGPTGGPGTQVVFGAQRSGFYIPVTLSASTTYTISVQYQQVSAVAVPFEFDYFDGNATDSYSPSFSPTTTFQTATFTFTTPASPGSSQFLAIVNNAHQIAGTVNFYGFNLIPGGTAQGYTDTTLETTTYPANANLWSVQDTSKWQTPQGSTFVGTATGELANSTGTIISFPGGSRGAAFILTSQLASALTGGQTYTISVRYILSGTVVSPFQLNYWDGNSTNQTSMTFFPSNQWQVATHTVVAFTAPAAGSDMGVVNNGPQIAGNVLFYGWKIEAGGIATAFIDPSLPLPLTGNFPPQPDTVPAPLQGLSYDMAYLDDFIANPLTDGAWIDGNISVGGTVSPIASSSYLAWDGDSVIDVMADAANPSVCLTTSSITDMTAGYFEIRAKWSGDPNQQITLALLSEQHDNFNNAGTINDCYPGAPNGNSFETWGEWNILKWCPSVFGNNIFVTQATQHWAQVAGVCNPALGEQNDQPASNPNTTTHTLGQLATNGQKVSAPTIDVTQFHVYSLLWTAGSPSGTLKWYIDGTLVTTVVLSSDLQFPTGRVYQAQIEQQKYFFALKNSIVGTLTNTPQHLYVDYARYWQFVPPALPTAKSFSVNATLNTLLPIDMIANNPGETVTSVAVVSAPTHGTATVETNKTTIDYTATSGTSDSFTYNVTNANGTSVTPGTVTAAISTVVNANLITDCKDFSTVAWFTQGGTSISATKVVDPNGVANGAFQYNFPTNRAFFAQDFTAAAGTYTASIYAKVSAVSSPAQQFVLGHYNGATAIDPANAGTESTLFQPTTSWQLFGPYTFSIASTDTVIRIVVQNTTTDTGTISAAETIALWGIKVETGSAVTGSLTQRTCRPPTAASFSSNATTATQDAIDIAGANSGEVVGSTQLVGTNGGATHAQSVTLTQPATINYTSAAGFTGSDTIKYTVTNGNGVSAVGTITLNVSTVGGNVLNYFVGEQPDGMSLVTLTGRNLDCTNSVGGNVENPSGSSEGRILSEVVEFAMWFIEPNSGQYTSASSAADGTYNSVYKSASESMAQFNDTCSVVRLTVESNGNWFINSYGTNGGAAFSASSWSQAFQNLSNAMHTATKIPIAMNMAASNGPWGVAFDAAYPGDTYVDIISGDYYDNGAAYTSGADLWDNFLNQGAMSLTTMDAFSQSGYTSNTLLNGPRKKTLLMGIPEWGIGQNSGDAVGAYVIAQLKSWQDAAARGSRFVYSVIWNSDGGGFTGDLSHYSQCQTAYKTAYKGTSYGGTWTPCKGGTITSSEG